MVGAQHRCKGARTWPVCGAMPPQDRVGSGKKTRRGDFRADATLAWRALGFLAAALALMIVATLVAQGLDAWFFASDTMTAALALLIVQIQVQVVSSQVSIAFGSLCD